MGETAFLYLCQIEVNFRHLMFHLLVVEINHFHFFAATNHGNVLVVKIDDLICIFNDRAGIRT